MTKRVEDGTVAVEIGNFVFDAVILVKISPHDDALSMNSFPLDWEEYFDAKIPVIVLGIAVIIAFLGVMSVEVSCADQD